MSLYQAALDSVSPRDMFMVRLTLTLRAQGITQAALAEEANIPPATLSRWMTGRQTASLEHMLMLNEALEQILYHGGGE